MNIDHYERTWFWWRGFQMRIYLDNGYCKRIDEGKFLDWVEENGKLNWEYEIGLDTEKWGTYKRWEYFEVYDRAEIEQHLMEYLETIKRVA